MEKIEIIDILSQDLSAFGLEELASNEVKSPMVIGGEKPVVVGVKRQELLKMGIDNLQIWMNTSIYPNHLYIGRHGRIFIGSKEDKFVYHFKRSKWHNPFKVGKDHSLEESLELYEAYLRDNVELMKSLNELSGKVLGCWCHSYKPSKDHPCHGDVLVKVWEEVFI